MVRIIRIAGRAAEYVLWYLGIAVGILFLARAAWWILSAWAPLSQAARDVAPQTLVQLGPWAAAFVAAFSVGVLAWTNLTRAREAINSDFRDFMQWALENVNENDDETARLFAYEVIRQFAKRPHRLLDSRNQALARQVYSDLTAGLSAQEPED